MDESLQKPLTDFLNLVLPALGTLVVAVIGWVGVWIKRWVEAKARSAAWNFANSRLEDAVDVSVSLVEQDVVAPAKGRNDWNDESKKTAATAAASHVEKALGPRGVAELTRATGSKNGALSSLVRAKIEKNIRDRRRGA